MKAGRISGAYNRKKRNWEDRETFRHGGCRSGAGRKKGSGKWGEETIIMRIPKSRVEEVMALLENSKPIEMI